MVVKKVPEEEAEVVEAEVMCLWFFIGKEGGK